MENLTDECFECFNNLKVQFPLRLLAPSECSLAYSVKEVHCSNSQTGCPSSVLIYYLLWQVRSDLYYPTFAEQNAAQLLFSLRKRGLPYALISISNSTQYFKCHINFKHSLLKHAGILFLTWLRKICVECSSGRSDYSNIPACTFVICNVVINNKLLESAQILEPF